MKSKQNKNVQDSSKSNLTNTNQRNEKDISNSLKRDAVGNRGANDYTPMNQTDNEQGTEKRRNKQ